MDIIHVTDDELQRLAEEEGPTSAAAAVIRRLTRKRAKDHQVFAWRAGSYYFVGPMPDAETEAAMIELVEGDDEEE